MNGEGKKIGRERGMKIGKNVRKKYGGRRGRNGRRREMCYSKVKGDY